MSTLSFQAHQSNHKQHNMSAGSAAVSGQHYHTGHENPPSTTGHDDGFTTIPPATQLSQDVEVGGVNDIPLNDHVHGRTTHDYAGALLQLSGNSVPSPQPLSQSSKQQTAMSRVEPMSATSATVTAGMEQRGTKRRAVGNSLPDSFISGDWSPGITHAGAVYTVLLKLLQLCKSSSVYARTKFTCGRQTYQVHAESENCTKLTSLSNTLRAMPQKSRRRAFISR